MPAVPLLLYFENSVGRISEHPDGYAMLWYAPGPRDFAEFQAFLNHMGRLLHRRGWNRVFGDQRVMTPYDQQERTWLVEYYLAPNPARPDSIYSAAILAPEVFAHLTNNQVPTEGTVATLTYCLFDAPAQAEAEAWLRRFAPQP